MLSLFKETVADKVFKIVKELPEQVQKKILSDVEKLLLISAAKDLDASVTKNNVSMSAIVRETRAVRKKIGNKYNAKKLRP